MHRSLLVAALALLFAGCTGSDGIGGPRDVDFEFEGSATIVGVVTDDAFQTLPGVLVLVDQERQVVSDDAGSFVVKAIQPGTHSIVAQKDGYVSVLVETEVAEDEIANVRLVLVPTSVANAYYETMMQSGFVGCSFGWGLPVNVTGYENSQLAVCGVPQVFGVEGLDYFMTYWLQPNLALDVVGIWGETAWQTNQALSNVMKVIWFAVREHGPVLEVELFELNTTYGESPIRIAMRPEHFASANEGSNPICPAMTCVLYGGHYATYSREESVSVVAMIQQRYDDYLTIFHGGHFAPDFTALPDA